MVAYRRNYVAGGIYFFTVTLQDRQASYLTDFAIELKECFRECKQKLPFDIDAIVILPEHLHCILTLPEFEYDYSSRWKAIKSCFTRKLIKKGIKLNKDKHGHYNLWQRRFWEHTIRDEKDYLHHIDYIHYNPVKHGLAKQVKNWPLSSFHQHVKSGMLPVDWGGGGDAVSKNSYGE